MLERRDEIVERVSAKEVLVRRVRIGVTESTALTWLLRLTAIIKETYPNVIVEAEVELSATLRDRLATDTVDLIVVPQAAASERFASIPVGTVENAWMCSPSLHSGKATIPIADIAHLPLLLQGNLSGDRADVLPVFVRERGEHGENPGCEQPRRSDRANGLGNGRELPAEDMSQLYGYGGYPEDYQNKTRSSAGPLRGAP